ncbi:CsbD family protein [Polaribacter glomeratus]|uniref:General stress protein CsbD n=1 Tax=Polaribacter glomeratus TaxID=102 RepID=A0A2S7WV85_9FLAO|nr:general stress protein CsbD [Polaribacter glomeratus]PQJ81271.1 general stress protein CsbD [Polaribacter glomeratus]TXD65825.1 general stress protein CsbD [Polaribacter glomeratus]
MNENLSNKKQGWQEIKAVLKRKFAKLTDNDLLLIEGKEDEMLNRLQKKLGKTKEEIKKIIAQL